MAQTVNALSQACGKVEISTNEGTSWTDVSGVAQSLSTPTQVRKSGEAYTVDGAGAIVTVGKLEPIELTFSIVYTEDSGEAYELIRTVFEAEDCENRLDVRWSPAGANVGDMMLEAYGPVISFIYPDFDASSANPIMGGFVVKVGSIATAAVIA